MKRKLAFFHGKLVRGGAEMALINLLDHLDYERFDVCLWLAEAGGELEGRIDPRVRIGYLSEQEVRDYGAVLKKLLKRGKLFSAAVSFFWWCLSKLSENDEPRRQYYRRRSGFFKIEGSCDAAIVYQGYNRRELGIVTRFVDARVKLAWLHGDFLSPPTPEALRVYRGYYEKMDRLVCVSEAVKARQTAYYPTLQDRLCVIYNLQNIPQILKAADEAPDLPFAETTLVTVGRLSREKGQELIPPIAKRLREAGVRFLWYVVGDGPARPALEEAIRQNGVETLVVLTGARDNPYPYIKNCTLYVQPSYQEGFCVVTFEAKILQKRVVVTDVSGMREQFGENEAFFAEPTVESLTGAVLRALSAPPDAAVYAPVTEAFNERELEKFYALLDP